VRRRATDVQVDAPVSELYGLTEEEIAIVEGREKFGEVHDQIDGRIKQWLAEVGSSRAGALALAPRSGIP